jgi:hypothetical protein
MPQLQAKESKVAKTDVLNPVPDTRPLLPWRALLLGTLLVPVNAFWITIGEVRWYNLDGTSLPLFITPVFMLFILALMNLAWRKMSPKSTKALRQEELLLIYIMLVTSCSFAGHDTLQDLFGTIGHPYWNASPENRWQSLFFRFLPKWLVVTNHPALAGFYHGNVEIFGPDGRQYLISWLVPLAAWGAFFLTLVGMYLCMTILIRHAWIENEKLTFPIVQLPIAMTAEDAGTKFFGNPIMWAGFAIAFSISGLNGLHTLFPAVPEMNIKLFQLYPYYNIPPWNAMGSTNSSFYPFAIGIAYFMPLDLSLSCWSFFILARLFRVVGAVYGYTSDGDFPYFGQQATGAWVGLGVMLLYAGKNYWREVWKTVVEGANSKDPAEARRYRFAIGGLLLGMGVLSIFSTLIGMSPWVAIIFFAIVFMLGFVITRVRAEFGAPHEINWVNPGQVMVSIFGTSAIGPQNLTLLSVLYWFNRGYRNHPMPNQLEAFKMMDNKPRVKFATIVGALCLAAVVSLIATDLSNLQVTYAAGGNAKAEGFKGFVGDETYGRLQNWLLQPTKPASTGLYYIIGGFVFTVALSLLRSNFEWWPLHPAGYALSISYAMEYFWLPVFIAWLAKLLIIRYGGARFYRTMIPFFLGLILGDYTCGSLWALIGVVLGIPTYKIYI